MTNDHTFMGYPAYGTAEARKRLPELIVSAMRGETIFVGRRGIPDAKIVSRDALILNDATASTLANGLGESQAQRMFARSHRPGGAATLPYLPDNNAADVVVALLDDHSGHDLAAQVLVGLVLESHRLYREAGERPPTVEEFLSGIALSAGQHPELTDRLRDRVTPTVSAVLRYIASFENDPPASSDDGKTNPDV